MENTNTDTTIHNMENTNTDTTIHNMDSITSKYIQVPYDCRLLIAKYIPINWGWTSYENDPAYYMGLWWDDYYRIYKQRAARTIPCKCKLTEYFTNRYDEDGEEASVSNCDANTHICQCSGSIDITKANSKCNGSIYIPEANRANSYICDIFHHSKCIASMHIIGCHCTFENTIGCLDTITIHNCICATHTHEQCMAFNHNCICQERFTISNGPWDQYISVYNTNKVCNAIAHLCVCLLHNYVGITKEELINSCKASKHCRDVVHGHEICSIPKHIYSINLKTNNLC